MKIEIGQRLANSNGLYSIVTSRLRIVNELFDGFRTANAQIELGKDYRGRDIVRLIVKDHGRTVQTAFAPNEFDNEDHFRDRLYQFVGQVAKLEGANDCPNCGMSYYDKPLPFRCTNCEFQTVQCCPSCKSEVPISDYKGEGSTLWKCPTCKAPVRASYVEPMFDSRGFFVQPLVELAVVEAVAMIKADVLLLE